MGLHINWVIHLVLAWLTDVMSVSCVLDAALLIQAGHPEALLKQLVSPLCGPPSSSRLAQIYSHGHGGFQKKRVGMYKASKARHRTHSEPLHILHYVSQSSDVKSRKGTLISSWEEL